MASRATGSVYRQHGIRGDTWRAKIRLPDGRQLHRRIGPHWAGRGRPPAGHYTRRTAEDWLRDTLRAIDAGTFAAAAPRTGATVAGVATDYLAHLERDRGVKPSTLRDYRSILHAHVVPEFGGLPPEQVTREHVERWQRGLTGSRGALSARTRTKVLTLLSGIMGHAVERYRLSANPVVEVRKPRSQRSAGIEVLSVEEVYALVRAAASEQDAAIYLTAAMAGLRMGELIALRWRDVDFAGSSLRVVASYTAGALSTPKSHQARVVPMAPEVARALAQLSQRGERTGEDDLVLPGAAGSYLDGSALRRRFWAALERAGLRRLRFHDLRHTFGTRCAAAGVDLWRIQHWLGHADAKTTAIYAHWSPQAADAALVADAFAAEAPPAPAHDER